MRSRRSPRRRGDGRALRALVPAASAVILPCALHAQSVPRVVPGWGVDIAAAAWSEVAWHDNVAEIYRAWSDYLLSDPVRRSPTPHWSAAEQAQWRAYDLTAGIAYKGFGATVLDIRPAAAESSAEYVVKTLFAGTSSDGAVRPVALTRVYAVRENGTWVFANALPRHTRDWQRVPVGPITYVVEPGLHVDGKRAQQAIAFADSVATAFGVPKLDELTYYIASSPESLHRAMGIDWTFGGQGHGYAMQANRMILSGDAVFREDNRHELVHFLLTPIVSEGRTHGLVSEGLATWLGGSVGRYYPALLEEYAAYLRAHPEVTLGSILAGDSPDRGWNPAGAVLIHMVYERGGTAALEELLRSGRRVEDLQTTVSRLLGSSWEEIAARWRDRIVTAAGS
jgi:hypothetical protein